MQVLEILSHVNKRIKGHNDIKLPLEDLVDLYRSASLPLVRNFALVYVEMAFNRTDSKTRLGVVRPSFNERSETPLRKHAPAEFTACAWPAMSFQEDSLKTGKVYVFPDHALTLECLTLVYFRMALNRADPRRSCSSLPRSCASLHQTC